MLRDLRLLVETMYVMHGIDDETLVEYSEESDGTAEIADTRSDRRVSIRGPRPSSGCPRLVRELGGGHIDSEWLDKDGDRWRFRGEWQYATRHGDGWFPDIPEADYGPYTEVSK